METYERAELASRRANYHLDRTANMIAASRLKLRSSHESLKVPSPAAESLEKQPF